MALNVKIEDLSQKEEEVRNRAVIYARYSSDRQKEASIEQQVKECMDYITRKGYSLVRVYSDSAKSASHDVEKRSEFLKLIDDSKYGEFDVVVSYALDRISREEHGGFYGYENTLNKNGVRIEYATQVFDDGYGGEISKAVHVTMAAEYVAQLRKNVVRGMRDNVMKGNYNGGGRLPIGIRIVDDGKGNKRYTPDEAVAPLIEQAFKLYVMGKSSKEIADFLNHNGVRNCYGNKISVNTVNRMIGNPIYKGTKITTFDNKVEHKIYTVEGVCEPIVSEDLWENAQLAHEKREYRGARSDARVEYILHGKLYCGICGTVMIANSGKSKNGDMYYYYACRNNKMKKGKEKCPKKNVSKTVIENAVMKIISDWVWEEERIAAITAACKKAESERVTDPRAAQLEASIRKHRERKQRASEMFLDSGDKIWAEHVKEETLLIEADEKELSAIRKHETNPKTTEDFMTEIKNLRDCWNMMQSTAAGRKKIVSNFVERIVVYDAYPDDPGRMKIELTIRTDPLGTYTEEITANIPIGVSGNERMAGQSKIPRNPNVFRGCEVFLFLGPKKTENISKKQGPRRPRFPDAGTGTLQCSRPQKKHNNAFCGTE